MICWPLNIILQKTARSCRFALHSIRKIGPFLTEHATQLLVQALVISRLDCCNTLLLFFFCEHLTAYAFTFSVLFYHVIALTIWTMTETLYNGHFLCLLPTYSKSLDVFLSCKSPLIKVAAKLIHANVNYYFNICGIITFLYTALQKFGNALEKWGLGRYHTSKLDPKHSSKLCKSYFGEETVSWHHVCHGMASPITRPQPNWATMGGTGLWCP